ncbi:hypothetical protein, partial [Acidianus sp. RZ1]|uniref:hypothetical protein n=1 Tax=Acidianus sp. RZ1 TaxID=1540082 RepID=UPI0014924B23
MTTTKFIPQFADSYPEFVSTNEYGTKLRELVFIRSPLLHKNDFQVGYRFKVSTSTDGKWYSLRDCRDIVLGIKARKIAELKGITTDIILYGFKNDLEKILIIHDVPIVVKNKRELIEELSRFLMQWNIEVTTIPGKVKILGKLYTKENAKLLDVDY